MDPEFRLLKNLTRKNTFDSIGFLLESRAEGPLDRSGSPVDSSKHSIQEKHVSYQISKESELKIHDTFFPVLLQHPRVKVNFRVKFK